MRWDSQMRRRRFMSIAATSVAAAGLTGSAGAVDTNGGSVDRREADGYEVWDVNGHVDLRIGDGETFENVLVDQRGQGNTLSVRAHADDWTVRNVGWLGIGNSIHNGGRFRFLFRASASGGSTGTVENVWMTGWGSQMGGMWVSGRHDGRLNVKNSYFAGFGNNSIYASQPGHAGGTGPVIIENSYSRNSTVGNFRIGTRDSVVRDSLVVVNDPKGRRGRYPGSGDYTSRPVTARHYPDQRAKNVSVFVSSDDVDPAPAFEAWGGGGSDGPGPELTVANCDVNSNAPKETRGNVNVNGLAHSPSVEVLGEGVPTEPRMAAAGNRQLPNPPELDAPSDSSVSSSSGSGGSTSSSSSTSSSGSTSTITMNGTGERTDYVLRTTGKIDPGPGFDEHDAIREIDGGWEASGIVGGGVDNYDFAGEVVCLSLEGAKPDLTIDGSSVSAGDFDSCGGS